MTDPRTRKCSLPAVCPRTEQPHQRTGGIERANIGALEPIADHARIREVLCCRTPSVLKADDVIHLVRERHVLFVDQQYSHRNPARCATRARSAGLVLKIGLPGSASLFPWPSAECVRVRGSGSTP